MHWAQRIAAAFAMDDATWRRHVSPWSVWTRFAAFPLLILAIWSRTWLGWWALAPIAVMVILLWYNPRAFPPPRSTDSWASKAVLGERVWLARDVIPIPRHHARMAGLLSVLAVAGMVFLVWGLYALDIWPTLFGGTLIILGKLWFVDRMVWLYEDMKDASPEYRSWLY
jgi:hypothetical protein